MHWLQILVKLTFFNDEITIDKMFETVVVAYNTDDNIGECIFFKAASNEDLLHVILRGLCLGVS